MISAVESSLAVTLAQLHRLERQIQLSASRVSGVPPVSGASEVRDQARQAESRTAQVARMAEAQMRGNKLDIEA